MRINKMKVSIVLPVFNEVDNLEKTVLSIRALQKTIPGTLLYLIISDSRSTDGTSKIAKRLSKTYKNVKHILVDSGLGVGLYEGHKYAIKKFRPDILVQIDADGQVDEKVLPTLIKGINSKYNLVLGSRFVPGGKNKLPLVRRIFTMGSSLFCRMMMGPLDIREFTNSARAFTPDLFTRINWDRLPWKRKTFIYMPAFLNEAILAGAKYKEIPLVFKNRGMGYSKNKIVNYTIDIVVYSIEVRLRKWGINTPLFTAIRG